MPASLFRLKTKLKSEDYALDQCAASRCTDPSTVIDDSRRVWPEKVALCDRHMDDRNDWQDAQTVAA